MNAKEYDDFLEKRQMPEPSRQIYSPKSALEELQNHDTHSSFELLMNAYTSLKKENNRLLLENNTLMGEIHKLKRLNNEPQQPT